MSDNPGAARHPKLHAYALKMLLFAVFAIRLINLDQFDQLFDESLTQSVVRNVLAGDLRNNWKFTDVPPTYRIDFYNFSSYFYVDAAFVKLGGILGGPPMNPIHWHRMCSVVAATLAAYLFFWLMRKWFDEVSALVFLAFMAVTPLLVQDAHYARPEAVEILLVGVLYLLCDRMGDRFQYGRLAAACACTGFLAAMKFSLLPMLVVPLLWVPVELWKNRRDALRVALTVAGSFLAGAFAGVPDGLLHPRAYWHGVKFLRAEYAGHVVRPWGTLSQGYVFGMEVKYFWHTLGPLLLILSLVGAIALYRSTTKAMWRSLFLPIVIYFGLFGMQNTFFERNLSHVVPLMLMLSAAGLTFLFRYAEARARSGWVAYAVAALLFAGAIIPPALISYRLVVVAMAANPEDRAKAYEGDLVKKVGLRFERAGSILYPGQLNPILDLAEDNREGILIRVDDYNDAFTEHHLAELGKRVQVQQVGFLPSVFGDLPVTTLQPYHSQAFRYLLLRPPGEVQLSADEAGIAGWKFRGFGGKSREINPGHVEMNSWIENGFYREVGSPRGGRSFGSYTPAKGDGNTGVLRMGPTEAVVGPKLWIPIVTGPNTAHLSVVVKDHASGVELAHMNPPVLLRWKLWRVDLPKDRKVSLDIIATDQGSSTGEWLAIGIPRTENPALRIAEELPMPAGSVTIQGSWTKDGYYPDVGRPATGGAVYGSWNGNDANVGVLHLQPVLSQMPLFIGIPVVTGPANENISVKVLNARTGKVISSLDPPEAHTAWWVWNVALPPDPDLRIEIVAEDRGTGFGQWLAVGQPHALR